MSDPKFTTPSDLVACGKRQLDALLDIEPNLYIRGVMAEYLIEHLTIRVGELKHTPLRPSQELAAFAASRAFAEPHNVGEIKDLIHRDTPVVDRPDSTEPVVRSPKDYR